MAKASDKPFGGFGKKMAAKERHIFLQHQLIKITMENPI